MTMTPEGLKPKDELANEIDKWIAEVKVRANGLRPPKPKCLNPGLGQPRRRGRRPFGIEE